MTVAVTVAPTVGEGDGAAGLGLELLDLENLVGLHAVLLTAGADYCKHGRWS